MKAMTAEELRDVQPVVLAYLGEAVYELLCREYGLMKGRTKIQKLHLHTVQMVKAETQSELLHKLSEELTEKEKDVVRRGRNVKSHVPKHADPQDYRNATGFESLFGYLYLAGETERIKELFVKIEALHSAESAQ